MEIQCKICGKKIEHNKEAYAIRTFIEHIKKEHNISKEEYIVKYELNGVHPTCACGCGNKVHLMKGWNKWRKYYKDHKNFVELGEDVILKLKKIGKEKHENYSYNYIDNEIINNSFNDFVNGKMSLKKISETYMIDYRTLKSAWIFYKLISHEEYKKIAARNNSKLGVVAKINKIKSEKEFYDKVYNFIMNNPNVYTINEINKMFGNKVTVTTLLKNIKFFHGSDFINSLVFGYHSKIELKFYEILVFYFGKENVKCGFKLNNKVYDFKLFNKLLIEYDSKYFHSTNEQKNNDIEKDNIAINNGYILIRIKDTEIKNIDLLNKIEKWKNLK